MSDKHSASVAASNHNRAGIKTGPKFGQHVKADRQKQELLEGKRARSQVYSPANRKPTISDREQRAIDQAIAEKEKIQFESRCYKPGTPEFEAVAATITPIQQIRKGISADVTHLFQDVDPTYLRRRNENYRELR